MRKLIPKHQNAPGPLLLNNYVDKPVWQQQEESYTPEWVEKLSPEEETRLKTIQEYAKKRKEYQRKLDLTKRSEYLGDWGVMTRSARSANPVPVLYHHLQNQGYEEQADLMAKNTGSAEAGVLMAIPTVYGLTTAPIPTLTSMTTGYLESKVGESAGEVLERYSDAPEYTSDALGLIGGISGGFIGVQPGKVLEIPFKSRNFKAYGSKRFWHDVLFKPRDILYARAVGNYPLTFKERRNMLTNWRKDIQEGIDYAKDRAKTLNQYNGPKYFFNPKAYLTGTKVAVQRADGNAYMTDSPELLRFVAFKNRRGLTFPVRLNKNSLLPNSSLLSTSDRILIGAHEAQHEIQDWFKLKLVEYYPFRSGSYKRFTHDLLNPKVRHAANHIIKLAGTKGEWEGSLEEMDSELIGWLAEQNLPYKYSQLSPIKQLELVNKAAQRFELPEHPSLFDYLFRSMELAGY